MTETQKHRPRPPTGRRRWSLASRIIALAVGIAVTTALLAGALAVGLTRATVEESAQQTLARLADGAADRADRTDQADRTTAASQLPAVSSQTRAVRTLASLGVESASIGRGERGDRVASSSPLARKALTPVRRQTLLRGGSLTERTTVTGVSVLIEGRPTRTGGIVLVQRLTDATATPDALVRRMFVALAIAAAVAIGVGAWVASRLARPLRLTADAAHALADGRRDVQVPPAGPTEVAEVASALNSLAASLSRSEGRQRDFLLSVSHDLRTPLTGIRGYAESLATGVIPPADAAHAGTVMLGESKRLERLVADLLDLARLDADHQRLEWQPTDLVALAHGLEAAWCRRCDEVGVALTTVVPTTPLVVTTDPARVRQLLDGLLENALRVTPAGRPIVVEVRVDPSISAALVEVRDGGPGLTDDDLTVAFEPSVLHERYRGVRPVGTGLGLAIVGRLGTLLGGDVEAGHSAEGGARFTLRLPREDSVTRL